MPEPILVSSFSHKGGVGKTTSIHNIAAVLAREFGLKILLIDADAQGNLTSATMHLKFRQLAQKNIQQSNSETGLSAEDLKQLTVAERAEEEAELGEELFYKKTYSDTYKKRRTLYECLKTPKNNFSDLTSMPEIKNRVRETKLQHLKEYGDLFFLPGDVNIHQFEEPIASGFTLGTVDMFVQFAPYPRVATRFFIELAKHHDIDMVLIDLNPAVSAWNRAIVMGSDYFTVTTLPDLYSRRAISSTASVLTNWIEDSAKLRGRASKSDFEMPAHPKFLDYLCNRVRIRKPPKSNHAAPTITQQKKIKALQVTLQSKLLQISGITTPNYHLFSPPLIKEFTRAGGEAPESGVPVAYLTFDELIDKESMNRSELERSQEYYLNAYYTAVVTIFQGLSDEDHAKLNDKLRLAPNQPQYQARGLDIAYGLPETKPTTPSKKQNTASQSARKKTPLLLQANLENQESITFREIENAGEGNCALYAMNINRNMFCKSLQTFFDRNPGMFGQIISAEIGDALEAKHLEDQENEYGLLKLNRDRMYEICDKVQHRLMKKHPKVFEGKSEQEKLTIATSLGDDDEFARNFITTYRKWQDAENSIKNFLKNPEIVQRYITALSKDKFWIGVRALTLYAYQEKINLRIWCKLQNDTLKIVKTIRNNESLSKPPVDILYKRGSHFTQLMQQNNQTSTNDIEQPSNKRRSQSQISSSATVTSTKNSKISNKNEPPRNNLNNNNQHTPLTRSMTKKNSPGLFQEPALKRIQIEKSDSESDSEEEISSQKKGSYRKR